MQIVSKFRLIALTFILLCTGVSSYATHWMGGEITWECQGGGDYVFQLKIYRDCNGVAGPTAAQLAVWNHPSLSSIPLNLISQTDISPPCNVVPGGPAAISCGSGGSGAVEEFVFESNPINIAGTPPAQGWVFTWDGFSRNSAIDNLQNPDAYGITLRAVMYGYNGTNTSPCFDSSPKFAELPATILCTGNPFRYNQNAFDPDLDSLSYSFGEPLDDLNGQFNPGVDPIVVPYEANYSTASPLPGVSQNANNVPATINPYTGEISFTSFTQGNFVLVVKVESWRCGQKIAEVYREIQTVLLACGTNSQPIITPPFANGSFADTVYAGDLVTFNFVSSDPENLQDGSPQSNILVPSGAQFGANFTNAAAGCANPPCAVLSDPIPLSGSQGINTTFTWQTDCSHVSNASACNSNSNTHTFVFKVTDDFCPAPGVSMPTISITVLGLPPLPAPTAHCATVLPNGDVTITWNPPVDTTGSFDSYEIWSSTSAAGPFALVGTENNIGVTSYTHAGADAQNGARFYYIRTISGCFGSVESAPSDTLQTMFLQLNPTLGTAGLSWNPIHTPALPTSADYYHIYMHYPSGSGNWVLVDSVPVGTENYTYLVNICSDFLEFRVELEDDLGCTSVSSVVGDAFEDVNAPTIPIMDYVTIDTASGLIQLNWNQNPDGDTQGYIIMQLINGNWIPIDTVVGINTTLYTDSLADPLAGALNYGVVAYDSCWSGTPPGPNTSALGDTHVTIFLTSSLDVCSRTVTLNWNDYTNVNGNVSHYEVLAIPNGGIPQNLGVVPYGTTTFDHLNVTPFVTYDYIIKVVFTGVSYESFSNRSVIYISQPPAPGFNYIRAASVRADEEIEIRVQADLSASVTEYVLLRGDQAVGEYEEVGSSGPVTSNPIVFTDLDVETPSQSYYYQLAIIDSCGDTSAVTSNIAKTILLDTYADSDLLANVVQWSAYEGWDGTVIEYRLYRSVNGVFDPVPIATLPSNIRVYQDDVEPYLNNTTGEFCYYVEAIESTNSYGIAESVFSNVGCAYQDPKFWIPSAFMVNSDHDANREFKPVAGYIEYTSYEFFIYNRWGQRIFETNDIDQGWDGFVDGKLAPEGVYVYHFIFNNAEGNSIDRRGSVTLLHNGN